MNRDWELQGKLLYLLGEIKQLEVGGEAVHFLKSDLYFSGGVSLGMREYESSAAEQSSMKFTIGLGKEF